MRKFVIKLVLLFFSISTYSQNSVDSVFDFVLNNYLSNRVQTKNFYILDRTYNLSLTNDRLILEQLKKDSVYTAQPWKNLISAFDSLNNQENAINKKNLNYKFISKKRIRKELDVSTSENGITIIDPVHNWKIFQLKHTDCEGIVTLTFPSVSEDNNEFIIYIDFYNASEKGFGDLIFGTKQDNKWIIKKEINCTQNIISRIVVAD